MRRLRIAMISEHASPLAVLGGTDGGGQNVYVGQLARHLAEAGHRVDIFTRRDSPEQSVIVCMGEGVRVIHVEAGPPCSVPKEQLLPFMDEFAVRTIALMRRARYDIVHANFWMSGMVAQRIKQESGIPFVVTFHALGRVRKLHQGDSDRFPAARASIEDSVIAAADGIIAECPEDERDLLYHYGADARRITVIPCGVDLTEMRPIDRTEAREALSIPPGEDVVLSLGRIVPRKGIDSALHALALLHKAHGIRARLVVVGGEPDSAGDEELGRLRGIAEELEIAEFVDFRGPQPREILHRYYSAANVFVTAPWYEPFGMTPLEAMACKIPVVGSKVGGIQFTVNERETGYLVPPKDADALATRVACLLRNPALAEAMGEAGLHRVAAEFTWNSVATQVRALYDDVIQGASIRRRADAFQASLVRGSFDDAMNALRAARDELAPRIVSTAALIAETFAAGGKVLVCGNGGSAADAQHFATELVGRFKIADRAALPVVALTADSAVLTAWANDFGFDDVFARQVRALAAPGDVVIGISTSGRSANVVAAMRAAKDLGARSVALTGRDGGDLAGLADECLVVPSRDTQHIQEAHSVIIHALCELIENRVAGEGNCSNEGSLAAAGAGS